MVEVPCHSLHARCIRRVLESLGAASTGELLDRTYGLSLSDQYWVRRENDPVEWKDINFFDNPFDEALGEILLTSYSSSHDISLNAPDVSTGGDLPKRWTIDKPPAADCSSSRAAQARSP